MTHREHLGINHKQKSHPINGWIEGIFHGKTLSMLYASILRAVRHLSSAFLQVATDW
jgi:hypothetical protein